MANESKDSYESALKQHGRKEFPAVLVDGRGNWNDFARTTNKNFHAQRLDSPELDTSLAMQEGGPEAVSQRILDTLYMKIIMESMAIECTRPPLTHPISPAVMAGVMYMAGYYAPLAAYRKS